MEFINLKKQYKKYKELINIHIQKILEDANFIEGNEVAILESNLANYVGRKYCITCGNGTDALMLSFVALGINNCHAIFCPAMTFIASVEPAVLLGGNPIFVDIDPLTYNIDPIKLEESIINTIKEGKLIPKVIVAVDFLGNPADYDRLEKIAKKYNMYLIEDAAQSMGASYKLKKCGSFGLISTTSFFPSKPLGCYGDGGAIFTDDDELNILLRSLKSHGKGIDKYDNIRIGFNSRLDTIQAAVLNVKLSFLDEEIQNRQRNANFYRDNLSKKFITQTVDFDSISAYAQFVLICKSSNERYQLVQYLKENNIPTIIYYPRPLHKQKAFGTNENLFLVNSELYADMNIGIPFSAFITPEEQQYIINKLIFWVK